jgi:4-amino-4-deoxy-L-arabinose transferase-like glycosyltransferase
MPPHRWTIPLGALAIAVASLVVMFATEPRLSIVWDEGYSLGREARLRLWIHALENPRDFAAHWVPPAEELVQQQGAPPPRRDQIDTRGKLLFDPAVLAWFWPFAREEPHGHPPLYAIVGLAGDVLPGSWPELLRARFGPMLVFSATAGILFAFVASRWDVWAGILASGAWLLQPRLFAHGHYATYDALLSSLWVVSIIAFDLAVESPTTRRSPRWAWVFAFGFLAACAADTKLTGWLLPLPFLVWSVIDRSRKGILTLLAGGLVAAVVLYALNPPWWTEPITGVTRFFASNLGRASSIRIKTLFLGTVYETPNGSLPWYNTLVWTVFITPVGFLVLATAGLVRAIRRWRPEPFGLLVAGHWAFLLRALPHTPGHDGERQFLPAFGVLALAAGLGAASIVEASRRWGRTLVLAALAEGAISVGLMMPVPLSYYSPLVGGLPGASVLGMEPTYYWDALSGQTLDWINRSTKPGEKVLFATNPTSWLYLHRTGALRPDYRPNRPGAWAWYVVQNRPGAFLPPERLAVERGQPAYVVRKAGVPLLWVFRYDDVVRLMEGKDGGSATGRRATLDGRSLSPPGQGDSGLGAPRIPKASSRGSIGPAA